MRIKIVDENKCVLDDIQIYDCVRMHIFDFYKERQPNEYILKNVIFIRGNDVKEMFGDELDLKSDEELMLIEVERVTDLGDPKHGGHNDQL